MATTKSLITAVLVCASVPAGASVVFTTFIQPGNGYDNNASYAVGGPGSLDEASEAMPFTLTSGTTLGSVDIALMDVQTGDSFVVSIVDDNSDSPGSTVLESWNVTAPSQTTPSITNLADVLNLSLAGGTQYWLVASATGSTLGAWDVSSESASAFGVTRAFSLNGGSSWTVDPGYPMAFDIQGNAATTPEPSTLAMVGLAAVSLLSLLKKRGI